MTRSGNALGPERPRRRQRGGAELWVSDGDNHQGRRPQDQQIAATIATGGKLRANAHGLRSEPPGRHRRQFQRRGAVLQPDLDRARPQDPGEASGAAVGREPGTLRLARAERHVLHRDPGVQRRQEQGPAGADRPEERHHRQAARARALPPAQPVDRLRHHDLPRLQHRARPQPQARRRHGGLRHRERQDRELWRGLGRQWRLDRQSRARPYYHATTNGALVVVDIKTRQLVQKVPTWNGARSLGVNLATNKVYVATTAKGGPCGGCIVAFAQEWISCPGRSADVVMAGLSRHPAYEQLCKTWMPATNAALRLDREWLNSAPPTAPRSPAPRPASRRDRQAPR